MSAFTHFTSKLIAACTCGITIITLQIVGNTAFATADCSSTMLGDFSDDPRGNEPIRIEKRGSEIIVHQSTSENGKDTDAVIAQVLPEQDIAQLLHDKKLAAQACGLRIQEYILIKLPKGSMLNLTPSAKPPQAKQIIQSGYVLYSSQGTERSGRPFFQVTQWHQAPNCDELLLGDYAFEPNANAELRIEKVQGKIITRTRKGGEEWSNELGETRIMQEKHFLGLFRSEQLNATYCGLNVSGATIFKLPPNTTIGVSSATGKSIEDKLIQSGYLLYVFAGFSVQGVELYPVPKTNATPTPSSTEADK